MVSKQQKFLFFGVAMLSFLSQTASSLRCVPWEEFQCKDEKRCIRGSYRCDGVPDCDDASDESRTECRHCPRGEHLCDEQRCIPGTMVCDGHNFCRDGSDERNCGNVSTCKVNEFRCSNGQKCIPMRLRCSGESLGQCQDGSDQRDCVLGGCPEGELGCQSGGCLRRELFCDGRENCEDGSDEKDCGYEDSDVFFLNEGPNIYIKKRTKSGIEFTHLLHVSPPMNRTTSANMGMKITGLAFDVRNQNLFVSDANTPAILVVDATSAQWRYLVNESIYFPTDVAFDWTSNNLYWVDSETGTAEVVSVGTLRRAILILDLLNPIALALSPNFRTLFIAESGSESKVFMFGLDGKNRRILDSVRGSPASLAVHPTQSVLYWTDPGEGTISYLNFHSSSPPKTLRKNISGVMAVTATELDVYFTSGGHLTSERANRIKHPRYEKLEGWKSITFGVKPSGKSECLEGNGDCDYICLTSEVGRSCACSDGKNMDKDGKICFVP